MLDAVAADKREFEGRLKIRIAGNGEVDRLNGYINANGLEQIVEYVGWVDGEAKSRLLAEADGFILPSYAEGLPLAILEAMSYGLPVIATAVGAIPEVVDSSVGWLISPKSPTEIGTALKEFIACDHRAALRTNAIKKSEQYLPPRVSQQLESIYRQMLT